MLPQVTRLKIQELRRSGYSLPEISRECHVPKSTASRHCKDVVIDPKNYDRWLQRRNASKIIAERRWLDAKEKAYELLGTLNERDLFLLGSALYWAEGSKKDLSFCNSDPEMIRLFLYILRKAFKVTNERIIVSLRIYEDLNKSDCLLFWSNITGKNLNEQTSIEVLNGRKKGKLKYGMCRVRVSKGNILLKEILSVVKRVNVLAVN